MIITFRYKLPHAIDIYHEKQLKMLKQAFDEINV